MITIGEMRELLRLAGLKAAELSAVSCTDEHMYGFAADVERRTGRSLEELAQLAAEIRDKLRHPERDVHGL